MSSFTVLVLCLQACLLHNVYGQYINGYGPAVAGPCIGGPYPGAPLGAPLPGPLAGPWGGPYGLAGPATPCGTYGGTGAGNVAVSGELPVGGATAVAGQVPIIGAVEYAGPVCAAGAVTISGTCACGCPGPYY